MVVAMLDNKRNGNVEEALIPHLKRGSKVSIMSSLFSVESIRLLISEPAFTNKLCSENDTKNSRLKKEAALSGTQ